MDDRRFDAVARAISASTSRRQTLRLLAAFAVLPWRLGRAGAASAQLGDECVPGFTLCTSATAILGCFDLSSDPFNCGGCGNVCPNALCFGGICGPSLCGPGTFDCGALGCVDLSSDPFNCGNCGVVCESGLVAAECRGGQCVRADCPPGVTYCGAVDGCRDLASDPNHCGGCGFVCADAPCIGGYCGAPPSYCGPGLTDCGLEGCVDTFNDLNNCGGCGVVCESGLVGVDCRGGECVRAACPPGITYCGAVDLCRDLSSDPNHCGGCGFACASGVCANGVCVATSDCNPGLTDCGQLGCVDLSSDRNNCGGCGEICPAIGGLVCAGGVCGCPAGWVDCSQAPGAPRGVDGYCADLANDPRNCGSCGNTCAVGVCRRGLCGPLGDACPAGQTNCPGGCVDLDTNTSNCGDCGFECGSGATCADGRCVCWEGLDYCAAAGACFDLGNDRRNCGRCGNACGAGQACVGGSCRGGTTTTTTTTTTRQSAPPNSILGWPFDPEDGPWTIVNGYRGEDEHAPRSDGSGNYSVFALDFARCREDEADEQRGACALRRGDDDAGEDGQGSWDGAATRGLPVLAPADGEIAWVDDSSPSCLGFAIDIAGHPGYRLALFHVEGYPERGKVTKGEPIGTVAEGGCGPGDHIHLVLYKFDPEEGAGDEPDAVGGRTGVSFAGRWAIAGCAYPDDKRTANQYRGRLVPCDPDAAAP